MDTRSVCQQLRESVLILEKEMTSPFGGQLKGETQKQLYPFLGVIHGQNV